MDAKLSNPDKARQPKSPFSRLWAALLILLLAPYMLLGSYARLQADDYCSSTLFRSNGFIQAQVEAYNGWSNRYATMFFTGIIDRFGSWGMRILPTLLILGLAGSSYLFIKNSFKRLGLPQPRPLLLILSAAVTVLTLASLPNLYQSIYWRAGSTAYTSPIIALNLLLAWLLGASSRKPSWLAVGGAALAAFLAAGFSTTNAAVQTAALLFLAFVLFRRKQFTRPERALWAAALAGTLVGLAVLALQPGARLRLEQMPPVPGLGRLIYLTMRFSVAVAYHSLIDYLPARLAALFTGLLAGFSASEVRIPTVKKLAGPLLLTGLAVFVMIAACCAPSAFAQSAYPEARAQTSAVYWFSAALLGAGFLAGAWLQTVLPIKRSRAAQAALTVLALVPLILALSQLPALFTDYRERAAAWDNRESMIFAQRDAGQRDLRVPALDSTAGLMELTPDPHLWVNYCAAQYYQVDSIRAGE